MGKRGILYVVATPIGNLSDITQRAVDVLKNVNIILSEDTRQTKIILDKLSIQKEQISYRDQNHIKVFPQIMALIDAGADIALVSDSGTPVISDPGFKLLQELIEQKVEIVSVPGPSSIISALSISGLPTDKFSFVGFLPKSGGSRKKILETYGKLDATLVVFESPFRVGKLLVEINETIGDRYVCLCRELTKMHEECVRGQVSELISNVKAFRGEYVVLVAKEGFKIDVR